MRIAREFLLAGQKIEPAVKTNSVPAPGPDECRDNLGQCAIVGPRGTTSVHYRALARQQCSVLQLNTKTIATRRSRIPLYPPGAFPKG